MSDKVLAEIARRKELAAYISEGEWSTIGDPVSPDTRILVRAGDSTVANVWDDFNNAEFIADSGTHRAAELNALEYAIKDLQAQADYAEDECGDFDSTAHAALRIIERLILGAEGEK